MCSGRGERSLTGNWGPWDSQCLGRTWGQLQAGNNLTQLRLIISQLPRNLRSLADNKSFVSFSSVFVLLSRGGNRRERGQERERGMDRNEAGSHRRAVQPMCGTCGACVKQEKEQKQALEMETGTEMEVEQVVAASAARLIIIIHLGIFTSCFGQKFDSLALCQLFNCLARRRCGGGRQRRRKGGRRGISNLCFICFSFPFLILNFLSLLLLCFFFFYAQL